ncbi:MAG: hydrogenase maturation protease [Planctomycetaceae bacterium]|nr:hydrogenase maturation protease [Planctomycetaceae bacterium]
MISNSSTLIVGIGSPHGDDQVGWEIARRIQKSAEGFVDVHLARTPPDLLDYIHGYKQLIICDACHGAGGIGSDHHWDWPAEQLEGICWSGTHQVSLTTVLALAAQLDRLPSQVQIWGIEIEQSQPGHQMSEPVLEGAERVVGEILRYLGESTRLEGSQHA